MKVSYSGYDGVEDQNYDCGVTEINEADLDKLVELGPEKAGQTKGVGSEYIELRTWMASEPEQWRAFFRGDTSYMEWTDPDDDYESVSIVERAEVTVERLRNQADEIESEL